MNRREGAPSVVLHVRVEPLEARVELGRDAEEEDVPLEARQREQPREQLDRGWSAAVALRLGVELTLDRRELRADRGRLGIVRAEQAFLLAVVGEQKVDLGVTHQQPAVFLKRILAPATSKPERAPAQQEAQAAKLALEVGVVRSAPRRRRIVANGRRGHVTVTAPSSMLSAPPTRTRSE